MLLCGGSHPNMSASIAKKKTQTVESLKIIAPPLKKNKTKQRTFYSDLQSMVKANTRCGEVTLFQPLFQSSRSTPG